MTQPVFVGVDVAKDWLDIHHPVSGAGRIENTVKATRAFATQCFKQSAWIIFEASGGYDSRFRDTLEAAGVSFSRINPDKHETSRGQWALSVRRIGSMRACFPNSELT